MWQANTALVGGRAASFNVIFYCRFCYSARGGGCNPRGEHLYRRRECSHHADTCGCADSRDLLGRSSSATGQHAGRSVVLGQSVSYIELRGSLAKPGGGFGVGCLTYGRKTTCLPTQNGPDQLFRLVGTDQAAVRPDAYADGDAV